MKYAWLSILALALTACGEPARELNVPGGDAERGRLLLRQFGCGTCHVIPGVAAANGKVGPPLHDVARRVYLAGVLPNTPQNMAAYIRSPQTFDPPTVMPDLQVGEAHARDMTAFLYTLR